MGIHSLYCCGAAEIYNLQRHKTPAAAMREVWRMSRVSTRKAIYVFTATIRGRYGERFADYIQTHALGEVVRTPEPKRNPNSGNRIHAWLFTPNWAAVNKLAITKGWQL
jgi:hypothetical protein